MMRIASFDLRKGSKMKPQNLLWLVSLVIFVSLACNLPFTKGAPTPTISMQIPTTFVPTKPIETSISLSPTDTTIYDHGPFQIEASIQTVVSGENRQLIIFPDGKLGLLSEQALAKYDGGAWKVLVDGLQGKFLGVDKQNRVWTVSSDGTQSNRWNGQMWEIFGPPQGWLPINPEGLTNPDIGFSTAAQSDIWLGTGQDIRYFNGTKWKVVQRKDLNMPDIQEVDAKQEYRVAYLDQSAQVWVGECDWGGPGPIGGGGMRRLVNGAWQSIGPEFDQGCVSAMAQTPADVVWFNIDGKVVQADIKSGSIKTYPIPNLNNDLRAGPVEDLVINPDGSVYPLVLLCGGASCGNNLARYSEKNGTWDVINQTSETIFDKIFIDSGGTSWYFSGQDIYHLSGTNKEKVAHLEVISVVSDGQGKLWLLTIDKGQYLLWSYVPGK
jgi:hypothetical protein